MNFRNLFKRKGLTRAQFYREWITALRSGEYKQANGALCDATLEGHTVGYCCLGVACDVAVKHGLGEWSQEIGDTSKYYQDPKGERSSGTLTSLLTDVLALDKLVPVAETGDGYDGAEHSEMRDALIGKNDGGDWSFSEIADVIELYALTLGVQL